MELSSQTNYSVQCAQLNNKNPSQELAAVAVYENLFSAHSIISCDGNVTNCERKPEIIRETAGGWRPALLIIGTELCERLATLGIAVNLVTYLHDDLHLPIPKSANIVTNFLGTSFLTSLLGGFVADTYLGRYGTIAAAACIQVLGILLIALTSSLSSFKPPPCDTSTPTGAQLCAPASRKQLAVLYVALYLTAFGTGGIKSSISGLGADQFDEENPKGRQQMESYFNWFFFGISTGTMLAVTVLVYVEDNKGRRLGYGVCAGIMLLALVVFLGGTKIYRFKPPQGSPLTQIAQVLVAAWKKRNLQLPDDPSDLYQGVADPQQQDHDSKSTLMQAIPHTNQFLFLDKGAIISQKVANAFSKPPNPWNLSSLRRVEEVKMVFRLLPIIATTIVFWTANAQMITFSIEQGATLKRKVWTNFQVPPASLTIFMQISILLTIPFYDQILVPLSRKWIKNDKSITTLQRIGVGLFLSFMAMVVAALVERKRLQVSQNIGNGNIESIPLPMSVFYLAPQYVLVGVAEAFSYIGQLDFFYRESPQGMRSMGTGLCLSTISLGFFLSSALVSIINRCSKQGQNQGWLANNLNNGHLDNFYWFLSLCSLISFLGYLFCSHWYRSANLVHESTKQDEECMRDIKTIKLENKVDL